MFGLSPDVVFFAAAAIIFFIILYTQGKTLYYRILLSLVIGTALVVIIPADLFAIIEKITGGKTLAQLLLFVICAVIGFMALRGFDRSYEFDTPRPIENGVFALIAAAFVYALAFTTLPGDAYVKGNTLGFLINNMWLLFAVRILPFLLLLKN